VGAGEDELHRCSGVFVVDDVGGTAPAAEGADPGKAAAFE
jgi:hypothetical protein